MRCNILGRNFSKGHATYALLAVLNVTFGPSPAINSLLYCVGQYFFWPLLGLLLLNYALVLGHWPTLKDYLKQLCEIHYYRMCKGAQETLSSLSPRALFIKKQRRNFPQVYQSRTALLLLKNWFDFILWPLWTW